MKVSTLFYSTALAATASAQCAPSMMEIPLTEITSMSFSGFEPKVERFTNTGAGNKVVLKGYGKKPILFYAGTSLSVAAGVGCETSGVDVPDTDTEEPSSAATTLNQVIGITLPFLFGSSLHLPTATVAVAMATGFLGAIPFASAQSSVTTFCQLAPIDVEIYIDATSDEIVMQNSKSGDFEVCPPESLYWKHHPDVYGGYEGCVGEKGYYPCAQDSQGINEGGGMIADNYPLAWDGTSCVDTGFDESTRTYWVLWGDPLDKHELNARTGLNPVVSFPFNRGPYPAYQQGVDVSEAFDDSNDARAGAKDFLEYLGAFNKEELTAYDVTMTEGAESGMAALWAAKALEIAQQTCNRDIFALVEVPAYGYSNRDSAALANKFASTFYAGTECLCFNTTSCNDPTVSITTRGWLPLTPLPVEMGGDGLMYQADSASSASPWFESMVFPENPSGVIKQSRLPDPNRRVCDGVYVWPMYFGMRDYVIPVAERPECSGWSFSITKAYSASVRAGFVIYKNDPVSNNDAVASIFGDLYSMTNGLYSEWSWYGQMQLWDMIMSKPISDPTSWIGAYISIMEEKWSAVIDGFANCPVVELTNPRAGAYAWFIYKAPYLGIQGGFVSSFFRDVLGVRTTTYNWGFRGATPSDYYGPGVGTEDFTRLQLFRDITVYEELARRAKIVCADLDATVGEYISVNQWAAGQGDTQRRLNEGGYASLDDRKRDLKAAIPDITDRQLEYLADSHDFSDKIDVKAESCAPEFTTSCLFQAIGTRQADF